jgi:outer membrane protein OmpA-like peptidoglycan-associated protein
MSILDSENEDYWIPLADIMTGLMLIFLLIAVSYMLKVHQEEAKLQQQYARSNAIVLNNLVVKKQLYNSLKDEFSDDLEDWQASIESQDLAIRFNAPGVLFDTGAANLKPAFTQILDDFFPRYLSLLQDPQYESSIAAIHIDGYTSSIWSDNTEQSQAYFLNMQLSQQRTMSVLKYLYYMNTDATIQQYLRDHFTANGLASSHLIFNEDGSENPLKSQRVEFKILLKGTNE